MNNIHSVAVALLIAALGVNPAIASGEDDLTALRDRSRAVVKEFATRLKGELTQAMSDGGPSNAIAICSERAPLIAAELSRESGAKVGRTSLRTRNPANTPEPWMRRVLEQFDTAGEGDTEYFAASPTEALAARYMKAIPAHPLCLTCHGEPAPDLKKTLDALYPHDEATGYEAGDIRGAFYVVWPRCD